MKTLGLIGGMSWASTQTYYRLINEGVQQQLGGLHSAEVLLHSVDFAAIERMQSNAEWKRAGARLAGIGRRLEMAGADALVLCTNTMHKVADSIDQATSIPFLHIGDITRRAIDAGEHTHVGLLGTRFTMEEGFLAERIRSDAVTVDIPDEADRIRIDQVIFNELCRGEVVPASREVLQRIIADQEARGVEAVIFACTEIGLLLNPTDLKLPVLDTTELHARAAVAFALADD
ncbi:aspartate/glutamate racemase family protein [Spiribacter curvatus]|nr:aspartate/glutamate racemase family protein [Spiribacter curvatus]